MVFCPSELTDISQVPEAKWCGILSGRGHVKQKSQPVSFHIFNSKTSLIHVEGRRVHMFRPSCLLLPYYCDTLVLHQSSQLNLIGNNRKFKMAKIVKFHPSLLHCIGAPDGCEGWVGFGDGSYLVDLVAPIPPPVQLDNNLLVADNLYYQMILNLIVKSGTSKLCSSDSCVCQFILFLYCWSLTNC